MSFGVTSNSYAIATGASSNELAVPVYSPRPPTSADTKYPIGKRWVNTVNGNTYTLGLLSSAGGSVSASWTQEGSAAGALNTLTGDTGTATPSAGNIQVIGGAGIVTTGSGATLTIDLEGGSVAMDSFVPDAGTNPVVPTAAGAVTMAGTANQITTTGGLNTLTYSVPSAFIAPGSVQTTTSLTVGTTTTATGGAASFGGGAFTVATGTAAINISADAAATTLSIGTGAGAKTVTLGSTNTTSTTTLTAGSGAVNCATDFNLTTVATKISLNGGAVTDFIGTGTLTSGTVTINNTNIAAADRIMISRTAANASTTMGELTYTISAGASFVVTSLILGTPGSTQTGDASSFAYVIFRQT